MEILVALCVFAFAAIFGGLLVIAVVVGVVMAMRRSTTPGFAGQTAVAGQQPFPVQPIATPTPRGWSGTVPARAIVLSLASTGTRSTYAGQRYEIRRGWLDIELPGVAPFEVQSDVYIPTNLVRDVLPGSTMEVRIARSSTSKLLVVGPDVGYAQGAVRTT